jgi:hypothetical protein
MFVTAKEEIKNKDLSPTVKKMVEVKEKKNIENVPDHAKIYWKDVKEAYPEIAQNLKDLFKNKPQITVEQLKQNLFDIKDDAFWLSEDFYDYQYGQAELEDHYGKEQEVLQYNIDRKLVEEIKKDALYQDFFTKFSRLMQSSPHPVHSQTIGWIRYYKFDKLWVVEEIQSDLFGENTRLRNFANSQVKEFVADYTDEEKAKLEVFFKENFHDWDKKLLSTLITMARREKVKDIWLFDEDIKKDTAVSPSKLKHFYKKVPRDLGFKRDSLKIGGKELSAWHRVVAGLKPLHPLIAALRQVARAYP